MKKSISIASLSILASIAASCSSQQTAWCSLQWPGTDKSTLSGDCRFNEKAQKASIDFFSHDYNFVFPNSNNGVNYERVNTEKSIRFDHNGYVLTVFPNGKPDLS